MSAFSSDFIIRIYRFNKKRPRSLVGIVEEVGVKGRRAFTTIEELWALLTRTKNKETTQSSGRQGRKI